MLNKKVIASILLSIFFLNFFIVYAAAATTFTVSVTNAQTSNANTKLLDSYFPNLKGTGSAIVGQGHDDGAVVLYSGEINMQKYGLENVYALPALNKYFEVQGDSRGDRYANDIINSISDMFTATGSYYGMIHEASGDWDSLRVTMEQFIMLDTLSEYFIHTKNDVVYNIIRSFFMVTDAYEANTSIANPGGYWTQLKGEYKDKDGVPGYTACNANTSLMAATAYSRFALALSGHVDEADLKPTALIKAEDAMAYVETNCYRNGFYTEHPNDETGIAQFSTQAFAVDALALLYRATKKTFYLTKADALLNAISAAFWDGGRGGAMEQYNVSSGRIATGEGSLKYGYHNALLAMACIDLFTASQDSKYLGLAMNIMNFMYNTLWDEQGTDIVGYTEWVYRNGTRTHPDKYHSMSIKSRMVKTNMLALKVNSFIAYEIKPWYEKYMMYLIIGGGVAIAVIVVAILIIKKRSAGRALPKVVKGLLGDED